MLIYELIHDHLGLPIPFIKLLEERDDRFVLRLFGLVDPIDHFLDSRCSCSLPFRRNGLKMFGTIVVWVGVDRGSRRVELGVANGMVGKRRHATNAGSWRKQLVNTEQVGESFSESFRPSLQPLLRTTTTLWNGTKNPTVSTSAPDAVTEVFQLLHRPTRVFPSRRHSGMSQYVLGRCESAVEVEGGVFEKKFKRGNRENGSIGLAHTRPHKI